MRFSVAHVTTYRYDRPVSLEPHVMKLRPRCGGGQSLLSFALTVDPAPAGLAEFLDPDGNVATQAWFSGLNHELRIASNFEVEAGRTNPFDFLLPPAHELALPLTYSEALRPMLAPYRIPEPGAATDLSAGIAQEAAGTVMPFLELATLRIFNDFRHEQRLEGAPRTAADTIASGEGSCRDFAMLLCAVCRNAGLAARFVSGYEQASAAEHEPHMHAWTEVYVPGGGWRGYDPSRGIAVSTGHVAVAAAAEPRDAAPMSGTFRGSAQQSMEIAISMRLG